MKLHEISSVEKADCQVREWMFERGRPMGCWDLGGLCVMLGIKRIPAASQWSFHITKHMLIRVFFHLSPSFIKTHSSTSQLSSSKEGWEMTGRHFPFVHVFWFCVSSPSRGSVMRRWLILSFQTRWVYIHR